MTTQLKLQSAVFPDLPRSQKVLDDDGNMTNDWYLFFTNLVMALQVNFKPEGIVIPAQSSSNIALLTGIDSIKNILYDSTTDEFKGNIAGVWKTFTLT